MTTIKQWHERTESMDVESCIRAMKSEIADLRAALQAQQGDAPADCRKYCQREADEAAKPKCKGCDGHGMVGNILDSDTCPFCKGSGAEDDDALDAARFVFSCMEPKAMLRVELAALSADPVVKGIEWWRAQVDAAILAARREG